MQYNISAKRIITASVFVCTLLFLFYIRIVPSIQNTIEFRFDRAFNYRMTLDCIKNGDVPAIDRLSTYPEGKDIKKFLPVGLYHTCAFFYKVINTVKPISAYRSIFLFCSICGALIFVPVYFISSDIYHNKVVALITAFLAGIIPAYLLRTSCYNYRYEILGVPLLFASLLFFIKAFGSSKTKTTFLFSLTSAIFMMLSLWMWRLSILFLAAYMLAFIFVWIRTNRPCKKWWIIFFVVIGLSFMYSLFSQSSSHEDILKGLFNSYGGFPKTVFQIILNRLGIIQNLTGLSRVASYNFELRGISLSLMFSKYVLSFSGVFVAIYIFGYFRGGSRSVKNDILFVFLIFFLIVTFLFHRNKIMLSPLVAIASGESIILALKSKRTLRYILLLIISVALIKTGYDSYTIAFTTPRDIKIDRALKQSLNAIKRETPSDAVILCHWSHGYLIQFYCNRATMTDGLLESPEVVKRIIETSEIYYLSDEEDLWNYCNKYGVTHLLIPNYKKSAYAKYAGVEYDKYFPENKPTNMGQQTILYKLLYAPEESDRFQHLWENEKFLLYRVKNSPSVEEENS